MPLPIRYPAKPLLAVLSAVLILSLGACVGQPPPDELARAVAVGERPVAMKGDADFFGGKVGVTVTISRGIGHGTGATGKNGANARISDTFGWDKDDAGAYISAKNNIGSPLPPVTLRLKLTSLRDSTVVVEVVDFESDLGNFAVYPSILALAPNQTAEPEPMISQLGVTSDEIPVKVSLRLEKKLETRTILVKNLMDAPVSQ
jgi:hypothetical protein